MLRFYPAVMVIANLWATINRLEQINGPDVFALVLLHAFFQSLKVRTGLDTFQKRCPFLDNNPFLF